MAETNLESWRERGRTWHYHGHPIFYMDEGQAPAEDGTVVCIHGFPTASWDWRQLWPALTDRHRVIAPDMIGFGFSAKPQDYHYSILDQADLHEGLLADLGIGRAHVLAHDYGDTVAQELLARHLKRRRSGESGFEFKSLCLLNGGLFPETHRARPIQKLLISPVGGLLARLMSEGSFRRAFSRVFGPDTQPSDEELETFWELVSRDGGVCITHKLIRYMAERRQYRERWVTALQEAVIPLRLIDGTLDPVSGGHMVARYRELIDNPDVVELDHVGHYPQVEDSEAVLRHYLDFLERLT